MLTALRNRLRRWLGLEDWESGTLEELRTLRTDIDRAEGQTDRVTRSLGSLRREVEELGMLAVTTKDALGGTYWTTATGHTRPIALLTDTHLKALVDNGFARGRVLEAVRKEQQRRTEDDEWARRQGTMSLRNRVAKLEHEVQPMIGRPSVPHRRREFRDRPVETTKLDPFEIDENGMREALLATVRNNLTQLRDVLGKETTDRQQSQRDLRQAQRRIDELEAERRAAQRYGDRTEDMGR